MSDTGSWVWRKSSYSEGGTNSDCVEVGHTTGAVAVRDTKNRSTRILIFTGGTWDHFIRNLPSHRSSLY